MSSAFAYPWVPDAGDGTYRNPVIHADYSDPDVIRHGEDFWLVASSFNCTPGLPILHSRDLVNWTLVNHAIANVPHPRYRDVQPGCGVWAPAIRFHGGKFWIFFPLPDEGIYVTNADHPAGRWSEPWQLQEAKGWIDPCPFWDDDGHAYLVHAFANSRAGKKERIHVRPMTPDCRRLLGEGQEVLHTPHHAYLEGPKVYKLDGWYYILAPGGGVPTGWQVAFRSRHIYGPYEEKIVLERGSTTINGPHQGALIDLPNGEWWFIHFQDVGPFGRITHLQPVTWKDGWPLMGVDYDGNGVGEPVPAWKKPGVAVPDAVAGPSTSDEFDADRLGRPWQWHANHDDSWCAPAARSGWLRLFARPLPDFNLGRAPHFLGQKYPAREFAVETLLDFRGGRPGEFAGLALVGGQENAALGVRRTATGGELVRLHNQALQRIGPLDTAVVRLRVAVAPDGGGTFGFAPAAGAFTTVPPPFRASEGGWIGAKVGLIAIAAAADGPAGHADFDYFRFSA
jgi:beta-xylosidase